GDSKAGSLVRHRAAPPRSPDAFGAKPRRASSGCEIHGADRSSPRPAAAYRIRGEAFARADTAHVMPGTSFPATELPRLRPMARPLRELATARRRVRDTAAQYPV